MHLYIVSFFTKEKKVFSTNITTEPKFWNIQKYMITSGDELQSNLLSIWQAKLQNILIDIYMSGTTPYFDKIIFMITGVESKQVSRKKTCFAEVVYPSPALPS